MLHVKQRIDGKWYVENFVKEHNHKVNPSHAYFFHVIKVLILLINIVLILCMQLE